MLSKLSLFKKRSPEEEAKEQQRIETKIQDMKDSIKDFAGKLDEDFILGTGMSGEFEKSFDKQIKKEKSSATKRWCQDVSKKLKKLDRKNEPLQESGIIGTELQEITPKRRNSVSLELSPGQRMQNPEYRAKVKKENMKEFKKIFGTTTFFDSNFLGTEVKVKATLSFKAAVNEVKKELNELSNAAFKPRP